MKRQAIAMALTSLACAPIGASVLVTATPQTAAARQPKIAKLQVFKATALAKFDRKIPFSKKKRHYPDFYIRLGRGKFDSYVYKSETRPNRKVAYFNQAQITSKIPQNGKVPFKIVLRDSDPGPDDLADISPHKNVRGLSLVYHVKTGEIRNPWGNRVYGKVGQTITVAGDLKRWKASVTFRIDAR